METYRFDFSVVMAAYNVEAYIREAVDSLVHQTLGFSHIQLILVDDGSKDGTGAICDEYGQRYPENVVVIHKENGGVSSARNAGLSHVQGRYLNFMDSDDKMGLDAFEKVAAFFAEHGEETDVVAIPLMFFDKKTGAHRQNAKFEIGEPVLDLYKHPYIINMFTNSSFMRADSVPKDLEFDARLTNAEDAKFALSVLCHKMSLGLVPDATYWYRRRSLGEPSAIQRLTRKPTSYIPYLRYFSNWALDMAGERFGSVPKFVQNEVMYDIQWKLKMKKVPTGVLSADEEKAFRSLLIETACRIDDDVILHQESLSSAAKAYVLRIKHGNPPEQRLIPASDSQAPGSRPGQDIQLCYGETVVTAVSEMPTVWEFLTVDSQAGECVLEGYHEIFGLDASRVEPCLIVNGEVVACQRVVRDKKDAMMLGEKTSCAVGFRATLALGERPLEVYPAVRLDGATIVRRMLEYGTFFPLSEVYQHARAIQGDREVTLSGGGLIIQKKPLWPVRVVRECAFLREIWKKNLPGGRKTLVGRLYCHAVRPFKRRKLWLVSDRFMKADDNGEALFRYIRQVKPHNVRAVFAISKKSADFKRMAGIGECVDAMSLRHKLLFLLCDMNISSHADGSTIEPYGKRIDAVRDLLRNHHYVFLQHGVIKDDLSDWLNRYNKDMSGFVTAASAERDSIVNGDYGYPEETIWLTGLPRHDRLYRGEKKWITLMPTWRKYLADHHDGTSREWSLSDRFEQQPYYQFYNALINSQRLLEGLEKYGYALKFFPHPNVQPHIARFHSDPRVECLPQLTPYRDVFASSDLVITDYSSAVFDFAYLRKPIVYCQFDKEEFFSGGHVYTQGYYDYERDGFGEVTYDMEHLIDAILEYAANGCVLKDKYRERIDRFFAYNDQDNCRRVVERIMALGEKQ